MIISINQGLGFRSLLVQRVLHHKRYHHCHILSPAWTTHSKSQRLGPCWEFPTLPAALPKIPRRLKKPLDVSLFSLPIQSLCSPTTITHKMPMLVIRRGELGPCDSTFRALRPHCLLPDIRRAQGGGHCLSVCLCLCIVCHCVVFVFVFVYGAQKVGIIVLMFVM